MKLFLGPNLVGRLVPRFPTTCLWSNDWQDYGPQRDSLANEYQSLLLLRLAVYAIARRLIEAFMARQLELVAIKTFGRATDFLVFLLVSAAVLV